MGTSVEEGSSQLLQAVGNATEEEVSGLFGHGAKVIIGQWGTYSCFVLTIYPEREELLNSAACPAVRFPPRVHSPRLGPRKETQLVQDVSGDSLPLGCPGSGFRVGLTSSACGLFHPSSACEGSSV